MPARRASDPHRPKLRRLHDTWPPPRYHLEQHPQISNYTHHSDVVLPPVNPIRPHDTAERPQLPPLSEMLGHREGVFSSPPAQNQALPNVGPPLTRTPPHPFLAIHDQRTPEEEQSVAMQLIMADPDVLPRVLDNGRYQCPLCPKNYKYAKHVRRHIINHTNLYPYSCPRCHALFRRKDAQRRHLQRIHPDLHSSNTRRVEYPEDLEPRKGPDKSHEEYL